MERGREPDIYINPSLLRPRALRSMLPVMQSRAGRSAAATRMLHPFRKERSGGKRR